ncbi:MAG: phenylalanine--tRNA ligase subunit beta [Gammaproteobacteria bacterium]|nr:phenylalanine--tRNA ligase subunit beta [Gammaproteobacteria bacterium]MDH5303032.1 phenylalanine--tRNA ligase subunit beta [Gammaproteobacteria bacterium]MDH5321194.1 phenylalanine--tRNA ligase subunit beta [Gammaproteobacteria bacterium]
MKIAESWIREWVSPAFDSEAMAHRLTMAGHEVDGLDGEGEALRGVVIAEVLQAKKHPDADRLRVCLVSDGGGDPIEVVCGAPNVVAGMRSPLAKPGVTLPNGVTLRKSKIRGVVSSGMLCSAVELGLGVESDGIIALPADAPVGQSLAEFLQLPDVVLDLNLTPNRGDCFSVLGIARDIAALTGLELEGPLLTTVPASITDTHPVTISMPEGCPSFAGRVIRGINNTAKSPIWLTERLRRSGLRAISPVVDVTNYVMLELGQPLHAYDLNKVRGAIQPRLALAGETLTLLDGKEVAATTDTIVISDDSGAIGLAGIMGGLSTAVTAETTDVFFEAAYWPQEFVAGRARAYGLHTDASQRFERGVDPQGQARAVERATELLLQICGGQAGPLELVQNDQHLPKAKPISLRRDRLRKLLGISIADATVVDILRRLGMQVDTHDLGWQVLAPAFRFDIAIEADLIEEVARIYGYDKIPATTAIVEAPVAVVPESTIAIDLVAATLVARDYQEVVSYSFIDAASNNAISGMPSELSLINPISSDMAVMRASLLPGLLYATAANMSRQQDRIRIFEIGKSFHGTPDAHSEVLRVAGACCGSACPEQWGQASEAIDFFDLKADVEAILRLTGAACDVAFAATENSALQPGQSANIVRDGNVIGVIGKLHPRHAKMFALKKSVYVFELDATKSLESRPPVASVISKYPSIRRDIAVLVADNVTAAEIVTAVASAAPELICDVRIFDIYKGPGIEAGLKSVALGLILQETSRTLTDEDADSAMSAAVRKLQQEFGAELRD